MHPPLIPFLLNRLSSFSALIPIIVALVKYRYLDRPLKIAFFFIAFSFILILVNLYCAYHGISNLVVFHFYAIFEFALVLWFFSYYVDGVLQRAIIPLVAVFAVWSVINFFFIQTGVQLNTYTRPIEAMIIVIYCIAMFNKQTLADTTHRWSAASYNWIAVAFLVFYACSFFIFIFSNYFLVRGDKISLYFWEGYVYILVIENLLLAAGFYKAAPRPSVKVPTG